MSVREEDRQKSNCPSRGLGLAAAAIGVGVGAALYYFFSKRPENPAGEGSTHGWQCEDPQTFEEMGSNESYVTISEYTTTDTSMEESIYCMDFTPESSFDTDVSESENADMSLSMSEFEPSSNSSVSSVSSVDTFDPEWLPPASLSVTQSAATNNVSGILRRLSNRIDDVQRILTSERTRIVDRERTWTLEECSICFDVILKDQEVMALPCTHNFHSACILPWLQEKQTCPNCREPVD